MSMITTLLIAAVIGLLAKVIADLFIPRYAREIGLIVFLLVFIARLS